MAGRALRPMLALALVAGGALAVALLLHPDPVLAQGLASPKPTPFGLGPAAPEPSGIAGYLMARQTDFYRAMVQAVRASKSEGGITALLAGLAFAYGVFHAAGPGHGKAVISAYLLADGGTLRKGALLALAAGLVQALVAILVVTIIAAILGHTAAVMSRAVDVVEIAAYGAIVLFGIYLAFVKGRGLIAAIRGEPVHGHGADCDCGDSHAPDPALLAPGSDWKSAAIAVLSAGARPCSGAVFLLTFALAQGVYMSGVIATFVMGLGTALAVTAIAALAVYAKRLAVRLAGTNSRGGAIALSVLELSGAVLVILFGIALLTGYLASERLLPG